jgi:hypothetical protein
MQSHSADNHKYLELVFFEARQHNLLYKRKLSLIIKYPNYVHFAEEHTAVKFGARKGLFCCYL